MNKKIFLFLLFFSSTLVATAQFDGQNSLYMNNARAFNPAAVGEGGMIETILQHRIQWIGMPNAGQTTNFSIGSPIKIANKSNGIGISFLTDEFARIRNQSLSIQYAHKFSLGEGLLSVGGNLGFINIILDTERLSSDSTRTINIGDYHEGNDQAIPTGSNNTGNSLDIGIGAWYSTNNWYSGISIQRLNQPVIELGENHSFKARPTLFVTGGYTFQSEKYPQIEYKPSALLRSDFTSWQLEAGAVAEISKKYRAGLAYRFQDALIVLAGMNVAPGLYIGYAYDVPPIKAIRATSGSHSFLLTYSFEYVFSKSNSKYKSIRIL